MKKVKLIVGLLVIILIAGGAFYIKSQYSSSSYYTKITNSGKHQVQTLETNEKFHQYDYTLKSANEDGKVETLSFMAPGREKPLRMNAYLRLEYNKQKGVISWEEVKKEEIPSKALDEIDK